MSRDTFLPPPHPLFWVRSPVVVPNPSYTLSRENTQHAVLHLSMSLSVWLLDYNLQNRTTFHWCLCPKCKATDAEIQQQNTTAIIKFCLTRGSGCLCLLIAAVSFYLASLFTKISPCLHNGETNRTEILVSHIYIGNSTFI